MFNPINTEINSICHLLALLEAHHIFHVSRMRVIVSPRGRVWGRIELCTGCWWGNLRERDRLGDPDVNGRIILRWIFRKYDVDV
jgi:hypothetical protein